MNLPISAVFTGLYALLILLLAANVSRLRIRKRISLGDKEDFELSRACRTHANAVEAAVVMVPLVLVYELMGGHPLTLGIIVATFLFCRLLHCWGLLSRTTTKRRSIGAALTYLTGIVLAVLVLLRAAGIDFP